MNQFIETGTYLGDTLEYVAALGVQCTSIELSQAHYEAACERFAGRANVRLVQGDSGQKLPEVLKEIQVPALFWLDGHYSGGGTACAATHTPVCAELTAILAHPIRRHVILVDDAHCFNGSCDYPHIDEVLYQIRETRGYDTEVSADIIRVIPREAAE